MRFLLLLLLSFLTTTVPNYLLSTWGSNAGLGARDDLLTLVCNICTDRLIMTLPHLCTLLLQLWCVSARAWLPVLTLLATTPQSLAHLPYICSSSAVYLPQLFVYSLAGCCLNHSFGKRFRLALHSQDHHSPVRLLVCFSVCLPAETKLHANLCQSHNPHYPLWYLQFLTHALYEEKGQHNKGEERELITHLKSLVKTKWSSPQDIRVIITLCSTKNATPTS